MMGTRTIRVRAGRGGGEEKMLALAEKFDLFRCPCDWKDEVEGIRDGDIKAQHGRHTSLTQEEKRRTLSQRSAVALWDICDNR